MHKQLVSAYKSLTLPGKIPSLDGLRALAILMVIITHSCQSTPGISFVFWNTEWATPLYNGWMGVDLFFVLSGFLISSAIITSLENNSFSLLRFYGHRFFRIIPTYFFVILLILIAKKIFSYYLNFSTMPSNINILLNIALLTDYFPTSIDIPSWSLSIEEHFYLLLPFFLLGFRKPSTRINMCILLIFIALICRMITYRELGITEFYPLPNVMKFIYFPFHSRMDALSVGVLISLINYPLSVDAIYRSISFFLGLLLVGFVFLTGALQGGFFNTTLQYSLICLGFGAILWSVLGKTALENIKAQTFFAHPAWIPIARLSYSIYLTHIFTLFIVTHFVALKVWMLFFVISACVLVALPIYLFVEYPCHEFARHRFANRKTALIPNQSLTLEKNVS